MKQSGSSRRNALRRALSSAAVESERPPRGRLAASTISVDLGFRNGGDAFEKVEITAFVGLLDVLAEHSPVAARVDGLGRHPGGAPASELVVVDQHVEPARRDVELDAVALAKKRERSANERFGGDVQNAGAVARPAHARAGDP